MRRRTLCLACPHRDSRPKQKNYRLCTGPQRRRFRFQDRHFSSSVPDFRRALGVRWSGRAILLPKGTGTHFFLHCTRAEANIYKIINNFARGFTDDGPVSVISVPLASSVTLVVTQLREQTPARCGGRVVCRCEFHGTAIAWTQRREHGNTGLLGSYWAGLATT